MSYVILLLGQLIPSGTQLSLFSIEYKVVYELKRPPLVIQGDSQFLMNTLSGHRIACL